MVPGRLNITGFDLSEKTKWELYKNAACCFEKILEAAPHKTPAV